MIRALPHPTIALRARLAAVARALCHVAGAPDYGRYLEHMRMRHPGVTPLTLQEFARERLAARYDTPGSRCC